MQEEMKRLFDFSVAICVGVFFLPVICFTALLIKAKLGSPVVFRQERPGLKGCPFVIYKFRTLTEKKDPDGNLLPDAERMTPLGQMLRKLSLDEMPELFNVLRGEMSLVGPRPLLMQYLDRYTPEQARRHDVKPGITGWAQINGRNLLSWERKFELDVWYVDHHNFLLDIKILCLTMARLAKPVGINQEGHATADEFMGDCG